MLVILYSRSHNEAETVRRKGLIDSAYGTKTVNESKGYYDTDGLEFGIEKQLATINENCMYTHRITGCMLKQSSRKILVMCVVMFTCFFIGINRVSVFDGLLQLFLSGYFLFGFLDVYWLHNTTKCIEGELFEVWSTFEKGERELNKYFIAKAMQLTLRYECALTRASIILDEKIYLELNKSLEEEWIEYRKRYRI